MTPRPRLALFALAPLFVTACQTKPQPYITSPSGEARGYPVEDGREARDSRPSPLESAPPQPEPYAEDVARDAGPRGEGEAWRGGEESVAPETPAPRARGPAGSSAVDRYEAPAKSSEPSAADVGLGAPRSAGGHAYRRPQPEHRPGLATEWGEARTSHVTSAPFVRAEDTRPFALGKLYYNDRQGLDAMSGSRRDLSRSTFPIGSGVLDVGLRGEDGRFVSGFSAGGDHFVPGYAGQRYTIVVRNHGPGRVEIVASVDGLDVIDGRPASYAKRGYLVEPWGEVEIDGFRTSTREVAAFRFGSVAESYAARKHGDTRNVGVIGIAAFYEQGDAPWRWSRPHHPEEERRMDANPFPLRFSTPPR